MGHDLNPIEIKGKLYYTVKQFSLISNRTTTSIYGLIKRGNRVRVMKSIYAGNKPFIPVSEMTEFPFTAPGPECDTSVYYLNEHGIPLPSVRTVPDDVPTDPETEQSESEDTESDDVEDTDEEQTNPIGDRL